MRSSHWSRSGALNGTRRAASHQVSLHSDLLEARRAVLLRRPSDTSISPLDNDLTGAKRASLGEVSKSKRKDATRLTECSISQLTGGRRSRTLDQYVAYDFPHSA